MQAFINGSGVISAQPTFARGNWQVGFKHLDGKRCNAVEPSYSDFIDAKQIRRMSRIIRMGIVTATLASRESGIEKPDGIITGTAFGCLEDTYNFLSKQVQQKEEMLSPTAFIHSTHNTISSQIGLWFGCRGYNSTYVHRSQSFESALLDTMLLFEEGAAETIFTGGVDEIIDASFNIMDRLGHFPQNVNSNTGVYGSEGAAFFALSAKESSSSYARIAAVEQFSFTDAAETTERIKALLSEHAIVSPGLLLAGYNGDSLNDATYNNVVAGLNCSDSMVKYKQWCGEYATASAFGTWLGAEVLRDKKILPVIGIGSGNVESILVYNNLENKHHSLILILPC